MLTKNAEQKQPVIPVKLKKLLLRASIAFIAWSLAYNLWLAPAGIPDNQITQLVVKGTVKLLSFFYTNVHQDGSSIFLNNVRAVNIANACNGLELIVLYIGFILIMPSGWKRMTAFVLSGAVVITLLNIIRCALLAWMYFHKMDLADIAHHYIFKLAIYAVVFYGWMLYSKKDTHAA